MGGLLVVVVIAISCGVAFLLLLLLALIVTVVRRLAVVVVVFSIVRRSWGVHCIRCHGCYIMCQGLDWKFDGICARRPPWLKDSIAAVMISVLTTASAM